MHHRVKNNLQIISSLLNLQLNTIEDAKIHYKFLESIDRVRVMATLHDLLYRSKNFTNIPVSKYFSSILSSLQHSYNLKIDLQIKLNIELKKDELDMDKAIPCGLILNEMMSNTLKYAFHKRKTGKILVQFTNQAKGSNHLYKLAFSDNGIGFKPHKDIDQVKTLGMQLIYSLVKQLDGELFIDATTGTSYVINF